MLKYVIYTSRLHIRDMFDETYVMASKGPVKGLLNNLYLHHCFLVISLF